MRRADAVTVRISHDWGWDRFYNIGGGISGFTFAGRKADFHPLDTIHTVDQSRVNRVRAGRRY